MTVSQLKAILSRIKRQSQPKVVISVYAFGPAMDTASVRIIQ